jgi:hypothetical protein
MEKKMIVNGSDGNGSVWTTAEMLMLYHLKTAQKTHKEIALIMGDKINNREYTENLIHKKWQQTDWTKFLIEQDDKESAAQMSQDAEKEKQKIIESTLDNQERLVKREQARTDLIIDNVKSAIYRLPKPNASDLKYIPINKSQYREEHAAIVLSDMHLGASFTMEETGGLSEYNVEIAKKRMIVLRDAVLGITERHRHVYDIPVLHIFCLGDIVAGMKGVGAWSNSYIDLDIYDQMIEGISILRDTIAVWAKAFKKVIFYGVLGNHGRCARRGEQKDYANWDKVCYEFLKISMSNYENIEWNTPKAWFLQEKILNHNFYLTHGDGIRGSMGLPYYGVERAERLILGLMPEKPDYLLLGHFHSPAELQTNSGRIIMNGSFLGGDLFSLKDLRRRDQPEQKMFGIHEKKGITWSYNIHLGEE